MNLKRIKRAYDSVLIGYRLARRGKANGFNIGYKLSSICTVNNEEGD